MTGKIAELVTIGEQVYFVGQPDDKFTVKEIKVSRNDDGSLELMITNVNEDGNTSITEITHSGEYTIIWKGGNRNG